VVKLKPSPTSISAPLVPANGQGKTMKVKVTATISWETELTVDDWDYQDIEGAPTTDDEILAYERKIALNDGKPGYHSNLVTRMFEGPPEISNLKIEKIEEASPAQSEAA
jgi:hypothetical protein